MKRTLFLLLLLIPLGGWAQITFKGTSPQAVVAGQQFRVNYTLASPTEERGKNVRLPETEGLTVLFGPTLSEKGSFTNIVNGSRSTQYTEVYTYTLLAEKEGEYTLPPAIIQVNNSEYKSNELKINVLPQDQTAAAANANTQAAQQADSPQLSKDDLFVRMYVSKSSVYENEGFLVTFELYSTLNVGVENLKFPEFEGFIAQEIELPDNRQWVLKNYQGRNYRTIILKQTILYPQRAGNITIGQGKFDLIVQVRTRSQARRSFFDDFFENYSDVKKSLASPSATINVKPLPAGKPASFTGAVGNYKMTSSITSTDIKADEPVTINITLSGNGNIKLLKNPEIIFPNDFEIYDPKTDLSSRVATSGVSGTKTIEYYAVPRYPGDFTIPAAKFSYFDLGSGTYKTLSTEAYSLHVGPGSGNAATVVTGPNKENIRFVGQDIRHIRTDRINFQTGNYFFGTSLYWLCYLIPLLLFITLFVIYRKQAAENANIALVRTKKASKVASKRLKLANRHLKANQSESFYDETLKAVWGYLSDKLNIPVASLTKDNAQAELVRYGASESLIQSLLNILNTAEFARFAPSQQQGTMDELYRQSVEAINQMEKI
jgi:hypothetical protein